MTDASKAISADDWKLPNRGRVGMLCLILTESAFFAIFVVAHLFYMGKNLNGPFATEVLEMPYLASLCLFVSSATITVAIRGLRAGSRALFNGLWLATIALGVGFLIFTAVEWYGLIYEDGMTIRTNLLGTTFYSLVGFHAAHVTLGVIMLTGVFIFSLTGFVPVEEAERVEVLSWYWHFVDAVWVVVLTVVYVIPLLL
ncbi:MAG: heme-copper oxidase subunit III [Myxococcota bacterium]|nr:heme-copper oxidase subunit III [Myxococcota bacterium]